MPHMRPKKKCQTPAPIGIEARLIEATRRYLRKVLEDAEWIGRELDLCLSPHYRPDAILADGYCKVLRWRLWPVVRTAGKGYMNVLAGDDMNVLAGYGVEPISLMSALSRSVLGEDFPRATNWLWSLLQALPADLWRSGKPPAESIVRDWLRATEMLRGCLKRTPAGTTPKADRADKWQDAVGDASRIAQPASHARQGGGQGTGGGKGAGKPGKSAAILASVAPQLRRKRKKRPGNVDGEVLTNCRRRCCLCFGLKGDASEKPGQIVHLDGDPSNDDKVNLAYLCLDHHNTYDSRTSQSKGLTIEEVRHYLDELYRHLETAVSPFQPQRGERV